MRRAVLAVAGLAAGTSLLVVVKGGAEGVPTSLAATAGPPTADGAAGPGAGPAALGSGAADPSAPVVEATPKPGQTSKAPAKKVQPRPSSGDSGSSGGDAPAAPAPTSNRVTGPRVTNPYGAVQVVIELDGNRITDVRTLEMPDTQARSDQLSALAEPQLREEALREQGANLDTVSGATETSESYRASLRVAIERMKQGRRD